MALLAWRLIAGLGTLLRRGRLLRPGLRRGLRAGLGAGLGRVCIARLRIAALRR